MCCKIEVWCHDLMPSSSLSSHSWRQSPMHSQVAQVGPIPNLAQRPVFTEKWTKPQRRSTMPRNDLEKSQNPSICERYSKIQLLNMDQIILRLHWLFPQQKLLTHQMQFKPVKMAWKMTPKWTLKIWIPRARKVEIQFGKKITHLLFVILAEFQDPTNSSGQEKIFFWPPSPGHLLGTWAFLGGQKIFSWPG